MKATLGLFQTSRYCRAKLARLLLDCSTTLARLGLRRRTTAKGRYVFYWGGILEFFCEKSRGPPISWNGLMHDPSEIPKQKHLTLSPTYPRQK